jgi:site-specific recombinase XerD
MTAKRNSFARLEGAYSENTLRSYQSAFEAFARWCRSKRRASMPAAAETVAAFVDAESQRLRPATIKHRLCAIRKIHLLLGHENPVAHPEVDLAIRRARRAQPSRPKQAFGVTANLRDQLIGACSDDLLGLRDKVLVSVGFDTLCRGGELVALSIGDLTLKGQGRYSVLVRRAKNDPEGAGRVCYLSTQTSSFVKQWIAAIGATKGPLLRPVYRNKALGLHLERVTISRVLRKLDARAGTDAKLVDKVSSHSLRVGAAQQLTLDGRDILQIMRVGGWRSMNVVARYIENMDVDVWS